MHEEFQEESDQQCEEEEAPSSELEVVFVCGGVRACARVCVRACACACACVRACVRVCVCVRSDRIPSHHHVPVLGAGGLSTAWK